MKRTLQQQIEANKRASLIYAFLLVVILAALGTVIVGIYSPNEWYYGTVGATLLGLIVALVANSSGPSIVLSISGAREANQNEDRVLRNVAEEMSIAAGVPMPKLYVIDDPSPNAFATGTTPENGAIAVTTGLLYKLNRDELQGVVAHEMGHIRNYDIRFMTAIGLIAGLIPLLADIFVRSTWFGGGRSSSRDRDGDSNLRMIFFLVGLVLSILAPICAVLLQMAVSRQREYLADATAAELTRYPEGLANALQKISMDGEPLLHANRATQHMYIINPLAISGGSSDLFSTHPSTKERIARLMGLAGNYSPRPPMNSNVPPTLKS